MATKKRLIDANTIPWEEYYVPDPDRNAQWDFKKELSVSKPVVDKMPTVDAVEVVHGHWDEDHGEYVCSCCQKHFIDELSWISHPEYGMPNYCPNCGAKMDGGAEHAC